jgi:hypothetical protein
VLIEQLTRELLPAVGSVEHIAPESVRDIVADEMSQWQECRIRDFVPIFVSRHVRARLLALASGPDLGVRLRSTRGGR